MKSKKVLICGSANISKEKLKSAAESTQVIIAADGGYDSLTGIGVSPDVLIGDMDSISKVPSGVEVISYPEDKDLSDLELALNHVSSTYPDIDHIALAGVVSEDRLDHTMANIYTAINYPQNITLYSNSSVIEVINHPGSYSFKGPKNGVVSVVTVVPGDLSSDGLKYAIDGALNTPSHGVSNLIIDSNFTLHIAGGKHLIFRP